MKRPITNSIKNDFPIFQKYPNLIYLDSTATCLKPKIVIDKTSEYYKSYSANVFRGLYKISEEATKQYEKAREAVSDFINASSTDEVIFVRGTTEGINLVCSGLGKKYFKKGVEVAVTIAEHHANFVPWQVMAKQTNSNFKVIPIDKNGLIMLYTKELAKKYISHKTKILALHYVSNVLGIINPLKQIIKNVRRINPNIIVVVDAAQGAASLKIDVKDLDCDFLSFSGHKIMGPTGIGVLWGKRKYLEQMDPYQYGGEMINKVTIGSTTYAQLPYKFEAGTPHIAGAIGLKSAINYLSQFDFVKIQEHEQMLWQYCYKALKANKNIKILGSNNNLNRVGIFTFVHQKIHAHDLSQILAEENICVRAGHHCAMPLHTQLKIDSSIRLTFYIYNSRHDIDLFVKTLNKAEKLLGA